MSLLPRKTGAATTPDTVSSDYAAMAPYWTMIETILAGAEAMREAGVDYLPQFPNETPDDYEYRRVNAKFTNVYADIVSTLSSKPFGEEVAVADDSASDAIKALVEDIDGRGNHLHVFAANAFFEGVNNAVAWILVDYTRARARADGRPLSRAEERSQGLRPYWVHVPAKRMLAVYTDVIGGKEIFVHARIREDVTVRAGYDEVAVQRIRVLDRAPIYEKLDDGTVTDQVIAYAPATFRVLEKRTTGSGSASSWIEVDSGDVTLGVIALVPFITGRRQEGSWRFTPPMQDAAFLQIEHYQQETQLKGACEMTAFPMLAGNGVTPPMNDGKPVPVPVSPKSVLYAPPYGDTGSHGEWTFIEPAATSLEFLAKQVKVTEDQMRELGRQPLTTTAGITVVAASFASQKASSVLKAWALGMKDALEQALKYTAQWLGDGSEPTVNWNLEDLDLATQDSESDQKALSEMRKDGDLSQETLWAERKRRGTLSADFDPEEERRRLEDETPDPDDEADIRGALPPVPEPEEEVEEPPLEEVA